MRISSVRISNFRAFKDETIDFDLHTCLLGPNGAGKSTVLAALNVFFQEPNSATSVASLSAEDFHNGNTSDPIRITVTFAELSDKTRREFSHYVRHNELIATAEAQFDEEMSQASVRRFGERLVFQKFAPYYEAEKNKVRVDPLRELFMQVTHGVEGFPQVGSKPTRLTMTESLRQYEEQNPDKCNLVPSSDLFYGPTGGKHKFDEFMQWVYIPAVKEASAEAEEAGNTALGKLLQRTVRRTADFEQHLNQLRQKTMDEYDALLEKEQPVLKDLSDRLADRLSTYSHSEASLDVVWLQGSDRSVTINEPKAIVKAKEGPFRGSLPRFGHGLQRSFLLAILQELAFSETESRQDEEHSQPTLVFACEEPELYQHPPQARHLNYVLRTLSQSGNQVLLTTHSPYFVSGEAFEEIRLMRKESTGRCSVQHTTFDKFSARISQFTGKRPSKPAVASAKLHAALQPERSEMFFCSKVIFVEGMEDRAYITAALMLENQWDKLRRSGLHIVLANGKSNILPLLVISQELQIPYFVVFDADSHARSGKNRNQHENDNRALLRALQLTESPFPDIPVVGDRHAIWPVHIGAQVKADIGEPLWTELRNTAKTAFDPGTSLAKNPLFIAETLRLAWEKSYKPDSLMALVENLSRFALI